MGNPGADTVEVLSLLNKTVFFKQVTGSDISLVVSFFFFNYFLFIYSWLPSVFVAAWAFCSCCEWELLFIAVHGLLTAVASLVAEHGL